MKLWGRPCEIQTRNGQTYVRQLPAGPWFILVHDWMFYGAELPQDEGRPAPPLPGITEEQP